MKSGVKKKKETKFLHLIWDYRPFKRSSIIFGKTGKDLNSRPYNEK